MTIFWFTNSMVKMRYILRLCSLTMKIEELLFVVGQPWLATKMLSHSVSTAAQGEEIRQKTPKTSQLR